MTLRKTKEIVEQYRQKFKLAHYDIAVKFDRKLKSDDDGSALCGCITWQPEYRQAQLHLNPTVHSNDEEMRRTVVHELAHLLLEGHQQKPNEYSGQYEFALNLLAELL